MVGKGLKIIHLLSLLLVVTVCGACYGNLFSSGGGGSSAGTVYNGFLCENTTSAWRCESSNGASFDFALYLLTSDGIALTAAAGSAPTQETFDWTQPKKNRIELTRTDGKQFTMDKIKGSIKKETLSFVLKTDGTANQSYSCLLDTVTPIDTDCDGIADEIATPVATPTRTVTPTPT